MKSFKIFYSWQSDITETKKLITKCLGKAIKKVKSDLKTELVEITLDRDTKGKSGTPDIVETIMDKIDSSNIFIGDVTIINSEEVSKGKVRPTSNPNVLFELGYAAKSLGWERVICLNDNSVNTLEELPFDIRSRRVSGFKDRDQEGLIKLIETAIKSIIADYDNILSNINESKEKKHDKDIFESLENIYNETQMKSTLEWVVSGMHITDLQYNYWDELQNYYQKTINHFYNEKVNDSYKNYLEELKDFQWTCIRILKIRQEHGESLFQAEQAGKTITDELKIELLQNISHHPHKNPYQNEGYSDADLRINGNQKEMGDQIDIVFLKYSAFIKSYKKNILI